MKKVSDAKLPKVKSGDVLEAVEMLRATITLLRQSFGIVFMASSITDHPFMTETEQKEFAINFDDLSKDFRACHQFLTDHYQILKSQEDSESVSK